MAAISSTTSPSSGVCFLGVLRFHQYRQLMIFVLGSDQHHESGWQIQETTKQNGQSSLQWKIQHISYECIYIGFSQLWTSIYFGDLPANHLWWHWSMVSLVAWESIWFPESGLLGRCSQSEIIPGGDFCHFEWLEKLQKHQGWSEKEPKF